MEPHPSLALHEVKTGDNWRIQHGKVVFFSGDLMVI